MELYFLRHGKAEDLGPEAPDDFSRRLTAKGVEETKAEARALDALDLRPDVIFTSPLVRARQTAEIMAKELGMKHGPRETDRLAPGCGLPELRELVEQEAPRSVMLVGHEPDLSTIVGELIGRNGAAIELKKGGLAIVELKGPARPGGGVLHLLVSPKLLARVE